MLRKQNVLGSYEIIRQLGEGSFGTVFLGVHRILGRATALKLFKGDKLTPDQLEEFHGRFVKEAKILASLNHENIVGVYDIFFTDYGPCIAMEYVNGYSLDKVDLEKIEENDKITYFVHTLRGIEAAHRQGVVHRDLKPGNLLLDEENGRIKITDFGISLQVANDAKDKNKVIGTWPYMAPEQVQGKKQDCRSDIWALGVILYKLYTGRLPFEAKSKEQLKKKICQGKYSLPSQIKEVPTWVERIIQKCLQIKVVDRYKSCSAILKEVPVRLELQKNLNNLNSEVLLGQLLSSAVSLGPAVSREEIIKEAAKELGFKKITKRVREEFVKAVEKGIARKIFWQNQEEADLKG